MSDEYLWDKTGSDSDVEHIERVLMSYRYRENGAPSLPVAEASTKSKRPFFLRLSIAFASAAFLVVIAILAVWIGMLRNRSTPSDQVAQTGSSGALLEVGKYEPANSPNKGKESPISAPMHIVARQRRSPKTQVPNNVAKRNTKRNASPLTKDERYAYNQLRLALWIAGTKAKVVQDTIDRVGEQRSPSARNEK